MQIELSVGSLRGDFFFPSISLEKGKKKNKKNKQQQYFWPSFAPYSLRKRSPTYTPSTIYISLANAPPLGFHPQARAPRRESRPLGQRHQTPPPAWGRGRGHSRGCRRAASASRSGSWGWLCWAHRGPPAPAHISCSAREGRAFGHGAWDRGAPVAHKAWNNPKII